jgi:hypothetical protein
MRRHEVIEVGDDKYEFTQVPVRDGQRLQLKLMKAIAKGVGVVAGDLDKLSLEAAAKVAAQALSEAISSLTEEDLAFATELLANNCCVVRADDKRPKLTGAVFDDHFSGRYLHLTKWLAAGLRFNYADFFEGSGITDLLAAAMGKLASQSPSISTGGSGES